MNTIHVLGCLILAVSWTSSISAKETNSISKARGGTNATNSVSATNYNRAPVLFDTPPKTVADQFFQQFKDRADSRSERRLHLFNTVFSQLSEEGFGEQHEDFGRVGRKIVTSSTVQGVREVAKDIPWVFRALNQDSFVSRVFRDSIGNTAEEDFDAGDIAYSKNEINRWKGVSGEINHPTNAVPRWQRFRRHFHPRYGSRLDYAYYAFGISRQNKEVFYGDIRYHYGQIGIGDIASSDLEVLASIPIGPRTFISGGFLQEIDLSHWDRRWSVKASHKIDGARVYIGITGRGDRDDNTIRCIVGFERQW